MLKERLNAVREELAEVASLPELKAIWCHWQAECQEAANDADCIAMVKTARNAIKLNQGDEQVETDQEKLKKLMEQLAAVQALTKTAAPVARAERKYKLLKTDVGWSTKPQVMGIMHIISAHANVGDILDESAIVEMMVANEAILKTKQGGKRIWDYYKGDHNEGLVAHGNMEKI